MSNRILRWGLLSTASINQAIMPPLRASGRNQLVAVASRSRERAAAYAKEWRIPRFFASYEALLADPEIDVVYISLPNSLHAEWAIKAAQAGKHVLCEKPLALSVAQVDDMATAARQAGVILAEGFMYRHHPQTLKVKELVDSGAIGKVKVIHAAHTFQLPPEGYTRLAPALGGGSIWDVACYCISYARLIAGAEPLEVFGWQVATPSGVDETFVGQLRFPGDVYAQFDSGMYAPYRPLLEVIGSAGVISLAHAFKPGFNEVIHLTRDGKEEAMHIPGQDPYQGEVEDMADCILRGKSPRVSLADSRGNVAAICALLQSAREGRPIPT